MEKKHIQGKEAALFIAIHPFKSASCQYFLDNLKDLEHIKFSITSNKKYNILVSYQCSAVSLLAMKANDNTPQRSFTKNGEFWSKWVIQHLRDVLQKNEMKKVLVLV